MQCNYCGSKWESENIVFNCPFCGNLLIEEPLENMTVATALRKIICDLGIEILNNSRMVISLISDYVAGFDKEKKLLKIASANGVLTSIIKISQEINLEQQQLLVQKTKKMLTDDAFLSEQNAILILNILLESVNVNKIEVQENEEVSQVTDNNISVSAPSVSNGFVTYNHSNTNIQQLQYTILTEPIGDFSGKGRLTWPNGEVYEGDFVNGKRTGKGRHTWPRGDFYEGDFVDDKRTGKGRYTWPDGAVYEGDYVDGKRAGKGRLTWPSGAVYEGDFVDGKRTGKGRYTWPSGKVYEGDFVEDKRTGKGRYTWPNGEVYEGDYVEDKRTGKGRYTWPNGEVYEGDFVDNKRTGKGKLTWPNGEVYEGDFVDGKCTGKGRYTWPNGEVYEGDFVDNKRTGKGKVIYKNGKIEKGVFKDGKMLRKTIY